MKEKTFTCEFCTKRRKAYTTMKALDKHIQEKHQDKAPPQERKEGIPAEAKMECSHSKGDSWIRVKYQCDVCRVKCQVAIDYHRNETKSRPKCTFRWAINNTPKWIEIIEMKSDSERFSHECKECTANCVTESMRPDSPRTCMFEWETGEGPRPFWFTINQKIQENKR